MAKRITGAILILAGAVIATWTIVGIFQSDQPFNFQTLFGLFIPVMLIKYGWQWLFTRSLESRRDKKGERTISEE